MCVMCRLAETRVREALVMEPETSQGGLIYSVKGKEGGSGEGKKGVEKGDSL